MCVCVGGECSGVVEGGVWRSGTTTELPEHMGPTGPEAVTLEIKLALIKER